MSYGDPTHIEGQLDGRILAWTKWSRLRAFAIRQGIFQRWTSENGVWVPARRLLVVLFAVIWLPAGVYVSFSYMGIRYVPPVLFDELEGSGREAAAPAEIMLHGRMPDSSLEFEWRRLPGVIEDVITLNARCLDLTFVGQANPTEAAQRRLVALPASVAPSAGRPVLTVTYLGLRHTSGKCVTTAWTAGRDATRLIGDAMPVLERLAVNPDENRDEHRANPCPDIARYAGRRGVCAEAAKTMGNSTDVSDVPLSQVSDAESDLLAMSAHGHIRTQEN